MVGRWAINMAGVVLFRGGLGYCGSPERRAGRRRATPREVLKSIIDGLVMRGSDRERYRVDDPGDAAGSHWLGGCSLALGAPVGEVVFLRETLYPYTSSVPRPFRGRGGSDVCHLVRLRPASKNSQSRRRSLFFPIVVNGISGLFGGSGNRDRDAEGVRRLEVEQFFWLAKAPSPPPSLLAGLDIVIVLSIIVPSSRSSRRAARHRVSDDAGTISILTPPASSRRS